MADTDNSRDETPEALEAHEALDTILRGSRPNRSIAELLAERRAKGLTAADLPRSPSVYSEDAAYELKYNATHQNSHFETDEGFYAALADAGYHRNESLVEQEWEKNPRAMYEAHRASWVESNAYLAAKLKVAEDTIETIAKLMNPEHTAAELGLPTTFPADEAIAVKSINTVIDYIARRTAAVRAVLENWKKSHTNTEGN